ncbi:hypothetical protein BDZ94DRAFT_1252858 [Collybia nuda]|uniref:CBM1 domain-containing protein n=1 Tax=Collybia nuda TaxID=64659 RepID=A0A9P6CKT7_9AGAR|nr:hypothetical protein BDZ94DRAFT_1252858 [Collybia nuda]
MLAGVSAQVPEWGQCGGIGWTGPTTCLPGLNCFIRDNYTYTCLRLAAPTTSTDGCSATPTVTAGGPATQA